DLRFLFYFFIILSPPSSTLFPYTTLFRSFHVTPCLPSAGRDAVTHGLGDAARIDVVINHPVQVHFELDSEFHVAIPRQTSLRQRDRKSTRLNSSHVSISYAVFCLKKKRM